MSIMDRLNALDDRMLPTPSASRWVSTASSWWSGFVFVGLIWAFALDGGSPLLLLVATLLIGFTIGFRYAERLRLLGRRSSLPGFRRPDDVA